MNGPTVAANDQTIQESPADARVTRNSAVIPKMAISRHLGYYPTRISAVRFADPKNPCVELNMEWIGCTVCEISPLNYTVTLKLGFGSLKVIESSTIR